MRLLLATDGHTRRSVWRDQTTGRMWTALPGEELAEIDTATIRHTDGATSVVVAHAEPQAPRLVALNGGAK